MTASFFPPLTQMLMARTAVTICEDSEVRWYVSGLDSLWDLRFWDHKCVRLMENAAEKISELNIPPRLKQSILTLIKPISIEMARWKYDHLTILGSRFDFHSCHLFWTPKGTIDRKKTAEMLVRDKNICIKNRFFLACCYFLGDDVKEMHNIISPSGQIEMDYFPSILIYRIARAQITGDFSPLVKALVENLYPRTFWKYNENPLWMRYFFCQLTPTDKKECLEFTLKHAFKDHDNFRFCISQVNEEQRESIFKENPLRLLRFLLDWPYQSLFSEAAEQMLKHLQVKDFRYLLYFIIYNRIAGDWYDFDYIYLLKDFWQQSPEHLKAYLRNDSIYEPVKIVISHDFTKLFPKEEIIRTAEFVDPPNDTDDAVREGDLFPFF